MTTPATTKQISSIVFDGWDVPAYGPQGKHTRKQWRKECLDNLLAGKEQFEAWQNGWKDQVDHNLQEVSHGCILKYEDGSELNVDMDVFSSPGFSLDYSCTKFSDALDFSNYVFSIPVLFFHAKFNKEVDFENVKFKRRVVFCSSIFLKNANLSNIFFYDDVFFQNSEFESFANLSDSKFKKLAIFSLVKFFAITTFNNSIFSSDAIFDFAFFNSSVNFENAIFRKDSQFKAATFKYYAGFKSVQFIGECIFSGDDINRKICLHDCTKFYNEVNFENAVFKKIGHFEKTYFLKKIPSFLGVDNATTHLEFSKNTKFNKDDIDEDAVKRLGQLKRLADEQGQTDQALMFNALELNAKAKQPEASCIFIVFTWLYAKVSNYGRSFGRPLFTYLGLVSITYILALLYAANSSPQNCKGEFWRVFIDWRNNEYPSCISYELPDDKFKLNGYRAAFEYTTYRAAGILDFSDNDKQTVAVSKRLFNADVEPTWMRLWGILKGIASIALLFLAGLGLRNKYRIK